ncbi:MAG TPA: histidinol dehydrogenase [Candidatus Acidoferrales bacterium]|jgi:histidinol dehydrogenase|nr:histidinol dehydrogenase [Candidatus Acidoferrales bacterium]
MRILLLTPRMEEKILAARRHRDIRCEAAASRIVGDVRRRGDAALFAWTRRLDGVRLTPRNLWVNANERRAAARSVPRELASALQHAARNIRRVAEAQLPRPWSIAVEPGVRVAQHVTPIETIGCYIPGGRFSLVSTLLMTAIPAQVAGVRRIVVACPRPNEALLAAAEMLGIEEIAHIGGAQAIAALACGTRSVPRVEKIFGPGNRFVTAAKKLVSSDCAIDLLAGPTELLIVAASGHSAYIAADLVAQAEHDPDAIALLVTTSRQLAAAVREAVAEQLAKLPGTNPARRSLNERGAILLAKDADAAVRFANRFAPEHLSIPGAQAALAHKLDTAGSIFIGPWSAQSIGDYASGTNHVLPTSGGARTRGGLSTADFVRCASVQHISAAGFRSLRPVVAALADAEGLIAHRRAVEVRK